MDNRKWLKRKYPNTFKKVNVFLNNKQLQYFKEQKYRLGRLVCDIKEEEIYKKGTLCFLKRSNPVNSYNYPAHTITVKCSDNLTTRGYNTFWVIPQKIEEIQD